MIAKSLKENSMKYFRLHISSIGLNDLKKDVYDQIDKGSDSNLPKPSTNDCLAATLYKAVAETAKLDPESNPDGIMDFGLWCNLRFRRQPPLPVSFFACYTVPLVFPLSKSERERMTVYQIASKMREKVQETDENFIQSQIDMLNQYDQIIHLTFNYSHHKFSCSNWNSFFDWFQDADLGKGEPEKFMLMTEIMSYIGFVLPGKEKGSLEITLGLPPSHVEALLKHDAIQKYFTHH